MGGRGVEDEGGRRIGTVGADIVVGAEWREVSGEKQLGRGKGQALLWLRKEELYVEWRSRGGEVVAGELEKKGGRLWSQRNRLKMILLVAQEQRGVDDNERAA